MSIDTIRKAPLLYTRNTTTGLAELDQASSDALAASFVGGNHGIVMWPTCKVEQTHAVDGTNGTTFLQIFHVPAIADCWRPIFANGGASAYTIASAAIRPIVGDTDFNASGGGWGSVYPLVLPSSGVVPARPSSGKRAGYLRANWLERPLIARTDSGPGCLVGIRTYIAAGAGTITIPGAATVDLTSWASRADKEYFVARAQAVEAVTTPANFTSTTNISYGPCIGIEYIARGRVVTIMGVGDSTVDGAGVTDFGDGWGRRMCKTMSSELGVTVQWVNAGWSGANSLEYKDRLSSLLDLGIKPDLLIVPAGTINDVATTITSSIVNDWRTRLQRMFAYCKDAGVPMMTTHIQPANRTTSTPAGAKDFGSTDSLRRDYNTEVTAAMPGRVIPFDTVMAGVTESSQVIIKAGYTNDGTHENDTASIAKAALAVEYVRPAVSARV